MRLSAFTWPRIGGINDPYIFKAVFLAGGGGSGKGFIGGHMFSGTGVKVLNSDLSFEYLLRQRGMTLKIDPAHPEQYAEQMKVREVAQHMEERQHQWWTNGMLGLVLDGTAKNYDKVRGAREGLEAMGYDTGMVFVNTSLAVSKERNQDRERTVPEEVLEQAWHATQENSGKYQNLFGSRNFILVDNSIDHSTMSDTEIARLTTNLRRKALAWLSRPLENRTGKAIIAQLQATGGKTLADLDVR